MICRNVGGYYGNSVRRIDFSYERLLSDFGRKMTRQVQPWRQIEWRRVGRGAEVAFAAPAQNSLLDAIRRLGSPVVPGKSLLEETQILLAAGAEIEHALLVQYLYAALSLGSAPTASPIRGIAVQEMCHLITVQNLLLFTGADPSLTRQDQDPQPLLDPFRFALRPLTKEVLEEFLLAEMPPLEDMSVSQRAIMEPVRQAHGNYFHPVGLVYARIFWLFQQNDQPDPQWPEVAQQLAGQLGFEAGNHIESFPGQGSATTFQVDPVLELEWRAQHDRGGVFESIDSRATALKTIADIARQGEGLASSPNSPSHFGTFLDIFSNTDLTQLPVVRLPTDPFLSDHADPNPDIEGNRITQKLAVALCRVFNIRYQILLAALRGALSRARSIPAEAAIRSNYANWALAEMRSSLGGLFRNILSLPAKDGGTPAQLAAAPPFALDGLTLPDDPAALDQLILNLHRSSAAAVTAALAQNPAIVFKLTLQAIQNMDKTRFPNL